MRRRILILSICAALVVLAACDRGARPAQIGAVAPDFTVTDAQRSVTLSKLRGKVVLLNFWASWCPPCVEETPALVALQKKMGDRITILGVSIDEDDNAYRAFIREHGIEFLTVRDPKQESSRLYGTFGWPETYVIDSSGVIRRKFIGPARWTSPEIIDFLTKLETSGVTVAAK